MKKIFIIGILAAIFVIAINTSASADGESYQGSPEAAGSYSPIHPIADQGGWDCDGSPECIKLQAERAAAKHKTAKPYVVENPCDKNPCLKSIKDDTAAIRASVGEPTPEEIGTDEETLQHKARKTLKIVKRVDKNVGESVSGRSLHQNLGDSKNGEDAMQLLREIHAQMVPGSQFKQSLAPAGLRDEASSAAPSGTKASAGWSLGNIDWLRTVALVALILLAVFLIIWISSLRKKNPSKRF